MSVIYRSTVGGISVNCRWYIGELSVVYRSTVGGIAVNCRSNISRVVIYQVSPMAFFLSKDVINYCSWHALRARNTHLLLSGFDLLHHAKFSLVQRPQIKLIYFCIEDGNSPLFNDQLLIKRADNVPRKVTKISSRLNTFIYCGIRYVLITLSCPFALSFRFIFIFCSK